MIRELKTDHPIIDLRIFEYRSFAIGTFLMTGVGFVLYGSTVLLPLLMQEVLGYTATHAGVTNFPRGFASFIAMPFIGILTSKVDTRKLLGAGVLLSATAMFLLSRFSLEIGFWNFWWALILQGAALGLIFVPLTTVTHDPVPKERLGNATSIFNLMRNIGASIGISMVETIQIRRTQMHINYLATNVTATSGQARNMVQGLQSHFIAQGSDPADALRRAYGAVWMLVQRQAAMLAYNDTFFFLAIMFALMFPFVLLLRRAKRGGAVMAH